MLSRIAHGRPSHRSFGPAAIMSSYTAPRPTPVDHFRTATSDLQEETEEIIHSTGLRSNGPPLLRKNEHLQFLLRNLRQGFPARYVHYDASQPWLLFWTLQGFSVLQVGMDPVTKQRCVQPLSRVRVPPWAGSWNWSARPGRSTPSWRGSTPRAGSAAVRDRRRTCCPPTRPSVPSPSSVAPGPAAAGIRSIGRSPLPLPRPPSALFFC